MGAVQRFERRLQGMVGDAFARVFGGSVVAQEVAQALQREADDRSRPLVGGRILAPNRYTVTLGASDHDRLAGDEQRVIQLLRDCVQEHVGEQGWDTYGEVVVSLARSETLHTGQFRTSSSVDPDASRRESHPRIAGDPAMSQQPGQYPEDDRRGKYGGYGYDQGQGYDQGSGQQYGYDQGQGQNYGGQQYGYDQGYDQGGYGHDQNYRAPQYDSNYPPQQGGYGYDQGSGQQYGYDQGYVQGGYGYGYDQGYGQGGNVAGQGYDQNYAQQYGGQQGGYGYDPGYGGAPPGYPVDPGAPGYAPPAVQAGSRQLVAMLTLDDGSNRNYQLTRGSNIIGRSQDAHFRLPDTGVSRRHLEITWDGQTAMLADLGSTNGTTVNSTPVQTWQLADGDVVQVGHTPLVFHTQG